MTEASERDIAAIRATVERIERLVRNFVDVVNDEIRHIEAPETLPPSGPLEAGD